MNLYKIVFSPTGGTDIVADTLAGALSKEYKTIDISNRHVDFSSYAFTPDDVCLFAVPSFGGRVPSVAAKRLRCLQGNGAKALLAAVYGNRAFEDTLAELEDIAKETGFKVLCGIAAIAEHSIIRETGHGRPDETDLKAIKNMAEKIKTVLLKEEQAPPEIPGSRPYRTYSPLPLKIFTNKTCTGCGLCAKSCPVGAIDEANPCKAPDSSCIDCMRCVAFCPVKAKYAEPEKMTILKEKLEKAAAERKNCQLFL